jgi:hypothetical protein
LPAGAFIGVGPAVIEDIFALAVALGIAERGGLEHTAFFDQHMPSLPASARNSRTGILQRGKIGVRYEWIISV